MSSWRLLGALNVVLYLERLTAPATLDKRSLSVNGGYYRIVSRHFGSDQGIKAYEGKKQILSEPTAEENGSGIVAKVLGFRVRDAYIQILIQPPGYRGLSKTPNPSETHFLYLGDRNQILTLQSCFED